MPITPPVQCASTKRWDGVRSTNHISINTHPSTDDMEMANRRHGFPLRTARSSLGMAYEQNLALRHNTAVNWRLRFAEPASLSLCILLRCPRRAWTKTLETASNGSLPLDTPCMMIATPFLPCRFLLSLPFPPGDFLSFLPSSLRLLSRVTSDTGQQPVALPSHHFRLDKENLR